MQHSEPIFFCQGYFVQYMQRMQTLLPFSGRVWGFEITIFQASVSEAYSESSQTSQMELLD